MSEKYYTPSIEDIHVGYECELYWNQDHLPENFWDKITIGESVFQDINWYARIAEKTVRTPYLNKEQIEAEGWEYVVTDPKGTVVFSKDHLMVGLFPETHRIQFQNKMLKDNEIMSITCPSINEFRKIVKWIYTK